MYHLVIQSRIPQTILLVTVLNLIQYSFIERSQFFTSIFEVRQEEFIIECFQFLHQISILVIQISQRFDNETVFPLCYDIHEEIYPLNDLYHEVMFYTALQLAVVVKSTD